MRTAFFLTLLLLAGVTYAAGPGDEGNVTTPSAPGCSVKASCSANEVCWFSLSNQSDAHVSDCTNDPYSYKLCCLNSYPATSRSSCNAGETSIVTYSSATGDAHLSDPFDPYSQSVCVAPQGSAVLNCAIKSASQQAANDQCEITLSSPTDAHASTCANPYTYGLYCGNGTVSAFAPHQFTASVSPSTTQNSIYIDGVGNFAPSQVQNANYEGSYALSYGGRDLVGVASFVPGQRDVIQTAKSTNAETVTLQQPVQNTRMFLIFTRADLDQVQAVLSDVVSPDDAKSTAFGYASDATNVQVGIAESSAIDIQGAATFLPGTQRVEIKKVDTVNDVQVISIKRTA